MLRKQLVIRWLGLFIFLINFYGCSRMNVLNANGHRTISMSNGMALPLLGLGTTSISEKPEVLKAALRAALDLGYRYIDTAFLYGNESIIGETLQEYYDKGTFARKDIFITTKLPCCGHANPGSFLKQSLTELRTDYIDLYLLHTPLPCKLGPDGKSWEKNSNGKFVPELVPLINTWRYLEQQYEVGVLKSIGISNFNAKQIQDLYNQATIKPHNLQVELHIFHPQNELLDLCKKLDISVTSYATLGSPGKADQREGLQANCLGHPLVVELAKKYNKTPAQILLRQLVQRGISTIPSSSNVKRMRENRDIFDFEMNKEDLKRLNEIHERVHLFTIPLLQHHPWYPFSNPK